MLLITSVGTILRRSDVSIDERPGMAATRAAGLSDLRFDMRALPLPNALVMLAGRKLLILLLIID